MLKPALYIAATPIGNLQDVTLRVRSVLQEVTMIAAEDTRHSQIFLQSIGAAGKKMLSCHNYNEAQRADLIAAEIEAGGSVALISDAGTPLISDPGYKLVHALSARGIDIVPLPGPCAAVTALCVSGLPTDKFMFYGFLPVKDQELNTALDAIKGSAATAVFYESPRRIAHTLALLAGKYPERPAVLCRELTKTFESVYRGSCAYLAALAQSDENISRGELVLLVGPEPKDQGADDAVPQPVQTALAAMIAGGMSVKGASRVLSDLTGIKSRALYQLALQLKEQGTDHS